MEKSGGKRSRLSNFLTRNIHQSWSLIFFCIGIVAGTVLGLVFRINFFASPLFLLLAGIFCMISLVRPLYATMFLALLAGFLVSFCKIADELSSSQYVEKLHGEVVLVEGKVVNDPETDDGVTKFKLGNLKFGDEKVEARGNLYISLSKNADLSRDDIIILSGKLSQGFGTYSGYMYRPKTEKILKPDPGSIILKVRNWFAARIKSLIPEPESNLGLSYLLGMKSGLPDNLSESLRVVGLVHIVVASGAHLSILVEVARKLFGKLSRFTGLLFSILFILFFMSLVGWTPSILRAGIMSILTLIGWYVGRKVAPWRIILIVAAGTLLINPMFIIDLGWLLSFASFAGIMILGPLLQRFFMGKKKPGFIMSTILTTLAATLMTLPIVLYFYGQVSLISVVANLLILPTLSYAMGLVFLTGVVAGIPFLETAISWCATKLLDFHIAVVEFFGQMEHFLVKIDMGNAKVFYIYILLILIFAVPLIAKKLYFKRKNAIIEADENKLILE